MGYWFVDDYSETDERDLIYRIGSEDIPEYLKIYSGHYATSWAHVFNIPADEITDKTIAYVTAARIAKKRRDTCATKKQVADKLGITIGAYNAYELAYVKTREGMNSDEVNYEQLKSSLPFRVPTVPKLIQLAMMFDCSVEYLIGVSDDENAHFDDYNKEIKNNNSPAEGQDPIVEVFNKYLSKLSKTQQGMLYGKLCEMLRENGIEI